MNAAIIPKATGPLTPKESVLATALPSVGYSPWFIILGAIFNGNITTRVETWGNYI